MLELQCEKQFLCSAFIFSKVDLLLFLPQVLKQYFQYNIGDSLELCLILLLVGSGLRTRWRWQIIRVIRGSAQRQ